MRYALSARSRAELTQFAASKTVLAFDFDGTLAPIDPLHDFHWDFGDPQSGFYNTSTDSTPTHIFTEAKTYYVSLQATNSNNIVQNIFRIVKVNPLPVPDFSVPLIDRRKKQRGRQFRNDQTHSHRHGRYQQRHQQLDWQHDDEQPEEH